MFTVLRTDGQSETHMTFRTMLDNTTDVVAVFSYRPSQSSWHDITLEVTGKRSIIHLTV